MLRNHIILAFRNLFRQKVISLINLAGLATGIASCLLIILFVTSEMSYDGYHEKSERIYRVGIEAVFGDSHFFSALTSGAMKEILDYEIDQVEEACRLYHSTRPVVRVGDKSFVEEKFFYSDPNFFEVFTVPLLEGDHATALSGPNTVILSDETAVRFFGDVNPLGKTILVNEEHLLEVTGVLKEMPHNSHFRYDFLASIETLNPQMEQYWRYWTTNNLYTYILLSENTDKERVTDRLQELVYNYVAPEVEVAMNIDLLSFEAEGGVYRFFIENIEQIHLHSEADNQIKSGGSISTVYFFSIIAIFILIIACINFMNLSTARFSIRAKEIGVRKTFGSTKGNLIRQFLVESVLISLIAMAFAIALLELALPFLNKLTYKSFELNYFSDWYTLPALLLFSFVTGTLAGSYPAFFLSSFKPVAVLKGETVSGIRRSGLRRILVIIQFSITIALIAATLIVSKQLSYIRSKNPGYNKEGLLVLKRTQILGDNQEAFRYELLRHENILNASFCTSVPGYDFEGTSTHRYGDSPERITQTLVVRADENYLETMGMELAEGRFFSADYGTDMDAVVINKPVARSMGMVQPTSEALSFPHRSLISQVIGVLEDANFESLHRNIRPMIIFKLDSPAWLMAVRLDGKEIGSAMAHIESKWSEFAGDAPFIWSFLEDDLMQLYTHELRTKNIFEIFALLALFIAALGLLGMASFNTEKRTREIGVRKALGASPVSIIRLLSGEINLLVLTATIISWPAAWFLMNRWLDNFAYRIEPGILTFVLATLITYFIALLTVGIQSWRAANFNPVDVLRNE